MKRQDDSASHIEVEFPSMCAPDIDQRVRTWDAAKRRRMARIFQRWSVQLLCSAEWLDLAGYTEQANPEPSTEADSVPQIAKGKTSEEMLKLAAQLDEAADTGKSKAVLLRKMAGIDQKHLTEKLQPAISLN